MESGPSFGPRRVVVRAGLRESALDVRVCSVVPEDTNDVLAVVRYSAAEPPPEPRPDGPLTLDVPLRPLGGNLVEVWWAPGPVRRERIGAIEIARAGDLVFGCARAAASAPGKLEAGAFELYARILTACADRHLYRFWNTVPSINDDEDGLERYKLFCRGRSLAFQRHFGADFPQYLPAASAVGSHGGDLVVYFLAGPDEPEHRENPRQVSAWAYPPSYGPRSPSFARATLLPPSQGGAVMISGTASVVGHASMHPGDLDAQFAETVRNIAALLANLGAGAPSLDGIGLLKVFVRHPKDADATRRALEARLGRAVPVLYLEADICRAELLLEIEGVATRR